MSNIWLEILLFRYKRTQDINIQLEIEDMIKTYVANVECCLKIETESKEKEIEKLLEKIKTLENKYNLKR